MSWIWAGLPPALRVNENTHVHKEKMQKTNKMKNPSSWANYHGIANVFDKNYGDDYCNQRAAQKPRQDQYNRLQVLPSKSC